MRLGIAEFGELLPSVRLRLVVVIKGIVEPRAPAFYEAI